MDKFACEFTIDKFFDGETLDSVCELIHLASSIPDLQDICDIQYDLFDMIEESDKIMELPEGIHHVYVSGYVRWESYLDWESGMDDGGWIFEWEVTDILIEKV